MERQMVSRMMSRALVWAQGNCNVTLESRENAGRAVHVGIQVGPCLLRDFCRISEELRAGDGDIYLGILILW